MEQENVFGVFSLSATFMFPLWPHDVPVSPLCDTVRPALLKQPLIPAPLPPALSKLKALNHGAF